MEFLNYIATDIKGYYFVWKSGKSLQINVIVLKRGAELSELQEVYHMLTCRDGGEKTHMNKN